jgi:hypothetical protein
MSETLTQKQKDSYEKKIKTYTSIFHFYGTSKNWPQKKLLRVQSSEVIWLFYLILYIIIRIPWPLAQCCQLKEIIPTLN